MLRKEKNMLIIPFKNGKENKINLDTGEIIGVRQKPIKKLSYSVNEIDQEEKSEYDIFIKLLEDTYYKKELSELASGLEKIISLGLEVGYYNFHDYSKKEMKDVKFSKDFVQFLKDKKQGVFRKEYWLEYQITKDLNENQIRAYEYYRQIGDMEYYSYSPKETKKILDWLYHILFVQKILVFDNYIIRNISEYFRMLHELEKPFKPERNFFQDYINIKIEYKAKKDALKRKKVIKNQTEYDLSYEDDTIKVLVPLTVEEFMNEGKQQHNCVGSYYDTLSHDYSKAKVVFVRLKDNIDKSYITVELTEYLEVAQAKKRSNQWLELEDKEILKPYLDYLDTIKR